MTNFTAEGVINDPEIQRRLQVLNSLNVQLAAAHLPSAPNGFLPPWATDESYIPPSRAPLIIATASVTLSIALITVVLRLYSRRYVRGHLGLDDWFILPALFFSAALSTQLIIAAAIGGMGKHIWDVPENNLEHGYPLLIGAALLYACSLGFIKLSLLSLIYRLSVPGTKMRLVTLCFVAYNLLFWIIGFFVVAFQCRPFAAGYSLSKRLETRASCMDQGALYMTLTALRVVFDFALAILPVPMILELKMSRQQKRGVLGVWFVGLLAGVSCVVRLPFTTKMTDNFDLTWNETTFFVLGQVETCLAIICASVPGLKPLFSAWFPRLVRSIATGTSKVSSLGSQAGHHRQGWRRNPDEPGSAVGMEHLGTGETGSVGGFSRWEEEGRKMSGWTGTTGTTRDELGVAENGSGSSLAGDGEGILKKDVEADAKVPKIGVMDVLFGGRGREGEIFCARDK